MATFLDGNQKAINQGNKYNNKKQQLIQEGFTSGRVNEHFSGMLGPNRVMNQVIKQDTAQTETKVDRLNDNLAQYEDKTKVLKDKTATYLSKAKLDLTLEKNYNIFINQSRGPAQIEAISQKTCVTRNSISNLRLASGFEAAYPQNFTNYADANNACKVWAADSDKTVYAVTKDETGKYQCSTGIRLKSKITVNVKPAAIYTVLAGDRSSIKGGLFANGQIGVWGGSAVDPQWNIKNMKKVMMIRKFNSNTYSSDETPFQQAINQGWWGNGNPPPPSNPNRNNWGVNMLPNSIAWWIGNLQYDNTPTSTISYGANDGTKSYFYYVYNAPSAMRVSLYAVLPSAIGLKINGVSKGMIAFNNDWFYGATLSINLPAGKNVFEISSATGLPNSGFVFYAAMDRNTALFKTGDPGWGVTMNPVPDHNLITNAAIDAVNPAGIKTVNPVPTGYDKCDAFIGGGVQKSSIAASYGRNCSNVTNPPLNVRYVRVTPNANGDYIQIAQIVVNAFVNGAVTNVAPRGTCTAANAWGGWDSTTKNAAITSPITGGWLYHSARGGNSWWQLDLGRDYPVTELIYYNRKDCCQDRANGMKIQLTANDGTTYQAITLSAGMKQTFNVSTNGLSAKPRTNAIKTMLNQKCLDQSDGRKNSLLQAQVWDCGASNPNQDFTYNADQTISAPGSNLCLDVYGGDRGNGTAVIQYSCHRGPNQKWTYGADKTLRPQHAPNKCMDVLGWNQANGAKLVIWDCHGGANQQWDIKS
jgi:hypothetical protein